MWFPSVPTPFPLVPISLPALFDYKAAEKVPWRLQWKGDSYVVPVCSQPVPVYIYAPGSRKEYISLAMLKAVPVGSHSVPALFYCKTAEKVLIRLVAPALIYNTN